MIELIPMLIICVFFFGMAWSFFVVHKATLRLKEHHNSAWVSLGQPSILNSGALTSYRFIKFFSDRKQVSALNDPELDRFRTKWLYVRWFSAIVAVGFAALMLGIVVFT